MFRSGRMYLLAAAGVLLAALVLPPSAIGSEPQSGFTVTPALTVPLAEDAMFFGSGGQAELTLYTRPGFAPALVPGLRVGYGFTPLPFDQSLSLLAGGAGMGVVIPASEQMELEIAGSGGYYYAFINEEREMAGGGGYADAGLAAGIHLSPAFSLTLSADYRRYLGLGQFLAIGLGGRIRLGSPAPEAAPRDAAPAGPVTPQPLTSPTRPLAEASRAAPLRITDLAFTEVFPVFFKYYDEHPVGSFRVSNTTSQPIEDLTITFRAGRYMDNPTTCRVQGDIGPVETEEAEVLAFFNESVLDITESTKVSAEIAISFVHNDRRHNQTYTHTVRLHDRNSMTWDDNRKPAAFVTARDPSVMTLSRLVSGVTSEGPPSPVPVALRTAMALHAAVTHYGMSYTPDPESPLRDREDVSHEIDYLQFPRQTLEYRGGDCDDLSILYAALFQALGIDTAFILVPGHVFLAFDLGLAPDEARRQLPRAEELIFRDGRTWIPVETTALDAGFLEAWQTGARQWREASAREQGEFLVTSQCWEVYEPVGLLGQGQPLSLPTGEAVYRTYHRELTSFIDQAIFPMVARIRERARESENPLPHRNRLAVLYGRYGLYDRARTELEAILEDEPHYAPALINLANIHLIHDEPQNALARYEEALELDPDNPRVLLSIAKINHARENYGIATRMLDRAKQIDPVLAERFSYIEMRGAESTRASHGESPGESVLWEETDE